MSDEQENDCPECPAGLPAWLATFADLMSLLMCFFVLLLSFAEMDVLKFKRLAGSMREAFGVQNQVDVNDIPKGTSIIAQEFSPGKPEPTPIKTVTQHTTQETMANVEVMCRGEVEKALEQECTTEGQAESTEINDVVIQKMQELIEQTEDAAVDMAAAMEQEIRNNMVEVETRGRRIIIRVQEKGSFKSGSADMQPEFLPVLDKLIGVLSEVDGHVSVEGHTDSIPISTPKFPSNWDLSTARALEVMRGLFYDGTLDQNRFTVTGHADTHPLVPNDTPEDRARNRRVEIILQQATPDKLKQEIEEARGGGNDVFQSDELRGLQGLRPDEIF